MRLLHLSAALLCAAVLFTADDKDQPPKLPAGADKAYKAYVAALQKASAAETAKVQKLLAAEQDKATKAGKLDDAMAIKGLLAEIDKGKGYDDAKAASQEDLIAEHDIPAVRGWSTVTLSAADSRWTTSPLREGVTAILNTNYCVGPLRIVVPKDNELTFTQIPQAFQGPLEVKVLVSGRLYVTSGMPLDRLMAQLPREAKPQAASGDFTAPGVISVVSCMVKAGQTFTLQGHEVRVIAGTIQKP